MELSAQMEEAFQHWYESLEKDKSSGLPDWGPICTGLIMLERLIEDYTLDIEKHKTSNGAQIGRQGLPLAKKILNKFHIGMKLTSGEFGRTNRSSVPTAERLLLALQPLGLENLALDERYRVLTEMQERLIPTLMAYQEHFQVEATYDPSISTEKFIRQILSMGNSKTSGAIAQHLVGAKLELRFPSMEIPNHSASTADAPTERPGDFFVGDTVFHVTMAPQDLIFLKCKRNLVDKCRVYLLVPEKRMQQALRNAKMHELEDEIVIRSIESFVGQNIDELSMFSTDLLLQEIKKLVAVYNRRIKVERYAPEIQIGEISSDASSTKRWVINGQVFLEGFGE
jgi:hypothetical protein